MTRKKGYVHRLKAYCRSIHEATGNELQVWSMHNFTNNTTVVFGSYNYILLSMCSTNNSIQLKNTSARQTSTNYLNYLK